MKLGYVWQDVADPYAEGVPDLRHDDPCGSDILYLTKRCAIAAFREYENEGGFDWVPRMACWKIKAKRVKV